MIRIYSLVLVLLLSGFSLLSAQPKLEIGGGDTYDWGNVKPEQGPLEAAIKLWNKGNKTLEIKRVKPGCGCTTDSLDMNFVPPGKYATLRVRLNITGYQGNTIKSVRISSDDPERPEQNLMLKCNVVVPVLLQPKYFSFNKLVVNEESVAKTTITNNTDKPIKLTNFMLKMSTKDVEADELKHNLRRNTVIEPKASLVVEMKFTPKKTGRLQASLLVETDNKEAGTLDLPIWGSIVDATTGKK